MTLGQDLKSSVDGLLAEVLEPYKPNCRYLKEARIACSNSGLLSAHGKFSILESCYISDTGHFNAVEFNICFNQLAYYFIAECVKQKLLPELASWDSLEFKRRQLSDHLIVNLHSSFHKLMKSDQFEGYLHLNKVKTSRNGNLFFEMECGFGQGTDNYSTGKVLWAIVGVRSQHGKSV